jgi:type IV pilus modification protein PilV
MKTMRLTTVSRRARQAVQKGMLLIESLVSIVILAIGILGLVAMAAHATATRSDSQYRNQATEHASEIIQKMWVGVDRSTEANLQASLQKYVLNGDAADACSYTGDYDASNTVLDDWVDKVTADTSRKLPGVDASKLQILYEPGASNRVTVTICWQGPTEPVARRQVLTAYIN